VEADVQLVGARQPQASAPAAVRISDGRRPSCRLALTSRRVVEKSVGRVDDTAASQRSDRFGMVVFRRKME